MARPFGTKKIESPEILSPEKEFELPYTKNKRGEYQILPNKSFIGGKNVLRDIASKKVSIGYVYLIKIIDSSKYKIGVSIDPKKRLSNISSTIPFDLEVLAINKIKTPYKIEQDLLDLFHSKLIKNEWFNLSIEDAKYIMITLHNKQVKDGE